MSEFNTVNDMMKFCSNLTHLLRQHGDDIWSDSVQDFTHYNFPMASEYMVALRCLLQDILAQKELLPVSLVRDLEYAVQGITKTLEDFKEFDDLDLYDSDLYDSVLESITIDHKHKSVQVHLLKVVGRIERDGGRSFTYKVKPGVLSFHGVAYVDFPHRMEIGEWCEFYRSAVVRDSKLLKNVSRRIKASHLQHIYLGIDDGNAYSHVDIVCEAYSMELQAQEYVLHDDFDWLD